MRVTIQGEVLRLLPERAVFWPRRRAVIITDTHWGKSAALRAAALPVPAGTTTEDLARLTRILRATEAAELIILGDLIHARNGRQPQTLAAIARWRQSHRDLRVRLIRGNHDLRAGDPPPEWGFECFDEPQAEPPFALRHVPSASANAYTLAGHLHPKVRLHGPGGELLRLPCFRFGPSSAVLPAFSALADGGLFQPRLGERIYVIADREIVEASAVAREEGRAG